MSGGCSRARGRAWCMAQSGRAALLPGKGRNTWSKSWIYRVQTSAQAHRLGFAQPAQWDRDRAAPTSTPTGEDTPSASPILLPGVQTPRGGRAMPGVCRELVIPHHTPVFLDMDSTTRNPSSPGAAAPSWVLGQVSPSPAVTGSFILATGKLLQLLPVL